MHDTTPMVTISLYYWAGAKAAAGVASETVEAATIEMALRQVRDLHADPRFDRVLRASSLIVDGQVVHDPDLTRTLAHPVRVEILPPFAGGQGPACPRTHAHPLKGQSSQGVNRRLNQ